MAINTLFQNIADAIRERGGTSAALTPAQMPQAIADIPGGGGSFPVLIHHATKNAGSVGDMTYTITDSGNYGILIFLINTTIDINSYMQILVNNVSIGTLQYEASSVGQPKDIALVKLDLDANDVVTMHQLNTVPNGGIQLYVFKNIGNYVYSFGDCKGNAAGAPSMQINADALILENSRWAYYGSYNTLEVIRYFQNLDATLSIYVGTETPAGSAYWYGGSMIGILEEVTT